MQLELFFASDAPLSQYGVQIDTFLALRDEIMSLRGTLPLNMFALDTRELNSLLAQRAQELADLVC